MALLDNKISFMTIPIFLITNKGLLPLNISLEEITLAHFVQMDMIITLNGNQLLVQTLDWIMEWRVDWSAEWSVALQFELQSIFLSGVLFGVHQSTFQKFWSEKNGFHSKFWFWIGVWIALQKNRSAQKPVSRVKLESAHV